MSLRWEIMRYGKDVVLLNERVERLASEYTAFSVRLEDHERRLMRIETLLAFAAPSGSSATGDAGVRRAWVSGRHGGAASCSCARPTVLRGEHSSPGDASEPFPG
jgi:hypothetical protein